MSEWTILFKVNKSRAYAIDLIKCLKKPVFFLN